MGKIRIGIVGYGNVGKSAVKAVAGQSDMELVGIFSRRGKAGLEVGDIPVYHADELKNFTDKVDVMLLCGGSATDLPKDGPKVAGMFNVIDSFDTHATALEYYESMNSVSTAAKKVSVISVGWDPGLFSLQRLYGETFLPGSHTYTFWGPGVSAGHSQAVRAISGVKKAIAYTIPVQGAMDAIRAGNTPTLSVKEKISRVCYVVIEANGDKNTIEQTIKSMPHYFDEYDTSVNFISEEEFNQNHSAMGHAGNVISSSTTKGNSRIMELSHRADSNHAFTSDIMVAYARAAYRLCKKGDFGAKTILDIAPCLISLKTPKELIKELL